MVASRWVSAAIASIALSLVFGTASVDARPSRVGQLPNGSTFGCANCHVNAGGGGPRNAFGQAVANGFLNGSGFSATVNWNATLAAQDADGDGVTNGAELGDPDGDGTPTAGVTVTNPGDATSFNAQPAPDPGPTRPDVAAGDILALVGGETLTPGEARLLEPGVHEFQLVFGVQIEGRVQDGDVQTRNLDVDLWPERIQDGIRSIRLSEDRLALVVSIDIPAETFLRIRVGAYPGSAPDSRLVFLAGTKAPPTGGVSGIVSFEGIEPPERAWVAMFRPGALDAIRTGDDQEARPVDEVELAADNAFVFEHVEDGDYLLFLRGQRGPDQRPLRAIYDGDGDGAADHVTVSGEVVGGIDFLIQPPPAPQPLQVVSLTIADQVIEHEASNPPVPAGLQPFSITFNRAIERRFSDTNDLDLPFDFDLIPNLGDDMNPALTLSEDGLTVTGSLDFPENTTFQLVFGPKRIGGENRQNFFFGTTDLPGPSVTGSLVLPEGIESLPGRAAGLVVLVGEEALAEVRTELSGTDADGSASTKESVLSQILDTEPGELMPEEEDDADLRVDRTFSQAIRVDVPGSALDFALDFVPDGDYLVGTSIEFTGPDGRQRRLVGFYDPEGTGSPAIVNVSGADVNGLSVRLRNPAPPPPRVRLGDLLVRFLPRLRDGEVPSIDIREILPGLNADDRRRLREIAGEDGLIVFEELRRVLGIPAPATPPTLVGVVVAADVDARSLQVRDDGGAEWTVLVTGDTVFEVKGEQNVLGGQRDGATAPAPATKLQRTDQPGGGNQGGRNPGGGGSVDRNPNAGGGRAPQRGTGLRDVAVGVRVEVFGEVTGDLTVMARRIVILGGGVVRTTFTVEGEIAFFDPFSLRIEMRNGQEIEVTRNTRLLGADDGPAEPSDLVPGTRVRIEGSEATRGRKTTLVAETIRILGGRPFRVQGIVNAVDGRTITLQPRAPEPIDPRARFGDARGRNVDLATFQTLLDGADGLQVLVKLNRFGSGIVGIQIYDPRQKKPIKDDERLIDAVTVSVEETENGLALVFVAPPPIDVPEGTPIRGDQDVADIDALVDRRVVVDGEAADGTLTALGILVVRSVDRIDVSVEVGDFDGQGVDNDARIMVLDPDGVEVENTIQVALDRERPVEGMSGDEKLNLRPGKHRVLVRVPDLSLQGEATFVIRDKGPGLQITETFPADGDVSVPLATEIAITFDGPIQRAGNFLNVVAFLRPGPNSGRLRDLELSEDGQTVFVPVELTAETTYTLQVVGAVSDNRQALRRPISITFSTGASVESPGSVSGSVSLQARTKQVEGVDILSGEVIAVAGDGTQAGRGSVETDGTFEVNGLAAGTYQLFATLETTTGTTSGFFDEGGDGSPDDVTVSTGQAISGLTIGVLEPVTLVETVVEDVTVSPVTLDLDVAVGDQGLNFVSGEPGGEVEVAVYLTGATDLLGFDLLLEYDPTALTFVEVTEDGDEEENLMKQGGGFALGITSPGSSSINWSVAILGPTDEQLGQGDGLLGVFRFTVNESFFGATDITVAQLVQEATSGATVIQPFVTAQVDGEGVTGQLAASAGASTISANGGKTTVSVELQDLDGLTFTEDNETEVTFTVESGTATVDGEASIVKTVSAGAASVELVAQASGTIGVRVTAPGASSVLVEVEAPGLGEGEVGPIALDTNADPGDQSGRILAGEFSAGDQVTIDIVAISGADAQVGFQATLSYDPAQLAFVDFVGTDLMAAAVPITSEISEDVIELNAAILGGQASGDAGSLGTATFEVLEGFTGQTIVELIGGSYDEPVEIGFGGALVQIGGSAAGPGSGEPTPDFDGDGTVGFGDFIEFASHFGRTSTSPDWDPKFDLDGDNTVGFGDFIVFAGAFGTSVKPALAKPVGAIGLNEDARLEIPRVVSVPGGDVVVTVSLSDVDAVEGFGMTVTYDHGAAELVSVTPAAKSLFGGDEVSLLKLVDSGVVIADVRTEPASGEKVQLLDLRFRMPDPTQLTSVELSGVAISAPGGVTRDLAGVRLGELRALPAEYALGRAFPNPFNPETQIAFQMPEAGNLSLVVYNTLGQRVRVLEQGPAAAGYHRVAWDGRDERQRAVSSGIYLVRMRAGTFTAVQKMLLLK